MENEEKKLNQDELEENSNENNENQNLVEESEEEASGVRLVDGRIPGWHSPLRDKQPPGMEQTDERTESFG